MELSTTGEHFWTDSHPIYFNPREEFVWDADNPQRFRLIYFRSGLGILDWNHQRRPLAGPALLCLNERDNPLLHHSRGLSAEALYFHPCMVNFAFSFENIRDGSGAFTLTEQYDRALLSAFIQRDPLYDGYIPLGPSSTRRFGHLMQLLYRELYEQPNKYWVCRSRSYLLELLIDINRLTLPPGKADSSQPNCGSEEIEPILCYLLENYQNKITIEELTRIFHTNRTTLAQKFSNATGMSVVAYLIRLRIQSASTMLRDTGLPVSEIMERVGFKNNSHFSKAFQKNTGYSPLEYRQKFSIMD